MKKKIFYVVSILLLFLLQSSFFSHITIAGSVPNLLIIFTASVAIIEGNLDGCVVGFFTGLLLDLTYTGPAFGIYALGYLIIGYVTGFTNRFFYREDITFPIIMIAGADIAYGIYMYIAGFLFRGRLDFANYFINIILPEAVYTVILTIILYRLILFIIAKLEKE